MHITFKNKKLRKAAHDFSRLKKEYGEKRAKKIKQRLDDLSAAETLEDTRFLPGNFHELKEDRKGQWACNLDQPYRLIFQPHEDPVPTDGNGAYLWNHIYGVEILEIIDYH